MNKIGFINKINRAFSQLEQEFEREPTNEELSIILNITVADVTDTMRSSGRHISMDAPLINGEDGTLMDVMPGDEGAPSPENNLINESLKREIERALVTLTPREADVIRLYFGLSDSALTLEEIGERFELTRERVRQIKEKAIRRLKHTSRSKILKTYLG